MKPLQVNRRLHLYLGILLLPWLVLYALGALVLNHRPLFAEILRHRNRNGHRCSSASTTGPCRPTRIHGPWQARSWRTWI